MCLAATIERPLASKRRMISPVRRRSKASGLTRIRVLSMPGVLATLGPRRRRRELLGGLLRLLLLGHAGRPLGAARGRIGAALLRGGGWALLLGRGRRRSRLLGARGALLGTG